MVRKFLFWCHLLVGIVVGLIVFVLCLTGVLLSFERASVEWVESSKQATPLTAESKALPPDELIARIVKTTHVQPQNIRFLNDRQAPVRLQMPGNTFICANAYTGEVLGASAPRLREFYKFLRQVHTTLTWQKTPAPVGSFVVGASNLAFVFLTLSGLFLWWPAQWRWPTLRNSLVLRLKARGKARDWNWHNALGFWGFLPLLIMAGSGIVLSYKAADDAVREFARKHVFTMVQSPQTLTAPADAAERAGVTDWAKILDSAQTAVPHWRSMTVPWNGTKPEVTIQVNPGQEGEAVRNVGVTINKATAAVVKVQRWENYEAGTRARMVMRLSHSGELGGLAGQTIAALGCLAGIVLVYTGFALSLRRFASWRRRRDA